MRKKKSKAALLHVLLTSRKPHRKFSLYHEADRTSHRQVESSRVEDDDVVVVFRRRMPFEKQNVIEARDGDNKRPRNGRKI